MGPGSGLHRASINRRVPSTLISRAHPGYSSDSKPVLDNLGMMKARWDRGFLVTNRRNNILGTAQVTPDHLHLPKERPGGSLIAAVPYVEAAYPLPLPEQLDQCAAADVPKRSRHQYPHGPPLAFAPS